MWITFKPFSPTRIEQLELEIWDQGNGYEFRIEPLDLEPFRIEGHQTERLKFNIPFDLFDTMREFRGTIVVLAGGKEWRSEDTTFGDRS